MDLQLRGRRALITGATRGIGRAIAEVFLDEGCHVAICARNEPDVERTIEELGRDGSVVHGAVADVADAEALKKWVAASAEALGGLDVLVSNVSAQSYDWRRSVDIDLLACVHLVESALPYLAKSSAASIVAVASRAGLLAVPSYKAYSAVKAALVSYMGSLSRELAPQGIRVNSVSPGEVFIEGGFWDRMEHEDPDLYGQALAKHGFGRMATPTEVARAVVFLASPAASFVSGTNLLVDGASRDFVQF